MHETASAATKAAPPAPLAVLRPASPAEVEAWCKAFGEPPSVPRQRGQTPEAAWETHNAYMDKLKEAFARSFGRTPTGQQSRDVRLLTFAEGGTRQALTQTAKRLERHWARASWGMTVVYLPTRAAKREYEACRDAVRQAHQVCDSALEALGAASEPVRELLLRAARDRGDQPGGVVPALSAIFSMKSQLSMDAPLKRNLRNLRLMPNINIRDPLDEAVRSRFAEARRGLQTKLLVQGVADHPVIAAYNTALETALEVVVSALHRINSIYTALWQQGERIVVLLQAKGEYRDPNDLTVQLRGREAQVRGVPVVRVTFERSQAREQLLQTAGQAYHDQVQTDAIN